MVRHNCGKARVVLMLALSAFAVASRGGAAKQDASANPQDNPAEFGRMAEKLAADRQAGGEEDAALEQKALGMLDTVVLAALNAPDEVALEQLNQRLAQMVTRRPGSGEGFRVIALAGRAGRYALAANFGLAGPSAVRVYAGEPGQGALEARIDRTAEKDFFDEYLEIVAVPGPPDAEVSLLVTVTGRTDELQSGSFAAWSFDGKRVRAVWSSDLLQQSSYEVRGENFFVTYCSETEEDNPSACKRMSRDRYTWSGTEWKRLEQTEVPVPKKPALTGLGN